MCKEIAVIGDEKISNLETEGHQLHNVEWDCDTDFEAYFFLTSNLKGEELRKFNKRAIEEGINWNLFYISDEKLYVTSFQKEGCLECLKTRLNSNEKKITGGKDKLSQAIEEVLREKIAEIIDGELTARNKFLEIKVAKNEQKTHYFFPLKFCKICGGRSGSESSLTDLKDAVRGLSK